MDNISDSGSDDWGSNPYATTTHSTIKAFVQQKPFFIALRLEIKGQPYTARLIKDIYEGRKVTQRHLFDVFHQYVQSLRDEPEKIRLEKSTIETYHTRLGDLNRYVATPENPPLLQDIDEDWMVS